MAYTQWWTRKWTMLTIGIGLILVLAVSSALQAQQTDQVNISVSPQVIEKSANPGDVTEDVVRVTNLGVETIEMVSSAKDIEPQGEEGSYIPTDDKVTYSLAQWMSVTPERVFIPPGESQDFTVTINYPSDAEPGGHFATAIFTTIPPPVGDGAGAQVQQELALPVFLAKIAGDITEGAELVEFKSTQSFWSNEKPITFETRVNNNGNVHFKPSGNIVIKNMFGNEVAKINIEEKNVLPGYIRRLVTEWEDPGFAVGRYTADLTLVYGDDDTIITASTNFTVFPYQTIIPATLLLGALLFIGIKFRKRLWMAIKVLSGKG